MRVYPNPAQSAVQFVFKDSDDMKGDVTVVDCVGRVVLRKVIEGGESLNIVDLAAGQYWIQFRSIQGAVYSTKLMIQ
jgi:hypothetical protein